MGYYYNFRGDDKRNDCFAPAPDFECVPCDPCDNPCEPKCPPKVRAKDAICIGHEEFERCFSLHQRIGCSPVQVPAFIYRIGMKVRKQGFCKVLTEECPIRADNNGNACFIWSDTFQSLEAGYYEADVYINDKFCFTLLFRKQSCWGKLVTETVENYDLSCEPPVGCIGCVPTADVETENLIGGCDDKCI